MVAGTLPVMSVELFAGVWLTTTAAAAVVLVFELRGTHETMTPGRTVLVALLLILLPPLGLIAAAVKAAAAGVERRRRRFAEAAVGGGQRPARGAPAWTNALSGRLAFRSLRSARAGDGSERG